MNNGIEQIQTVFDGLLNNISKPRLKTLYRQIGQEIAKSQRQRIARNQNPDGTAYAPRKIQAKRKKGGTKRQAMFAKIKTAKYLKTKITPQGVEIGYSGRTGVIANIHQYGLIGRVDKAGRIKTRYIQRQLLGFTKEDRQKIEDYVIKTLSGKYS